MPFMKPEVVEGDWYVIETNEGQECVPAELIGDAPFSRVQCPHTPMEKLIAEDVFEVKLHEFISGSEIFEWRRVTGFGARLSARGYLDCTEWTFHDTEQEALDYLEMMFGDETEGESE